MKKIDFGQTFQVPANVGVISGIVFLAIELDQNQMLLEEQVKLARLSARDVTNEYYNEISQCFSGILSSTKSG